MRKIVVEMARSDLEDTSYGPELRGIESLQIIQLLKYDRKGYAGIVRTKLRPPLRKPGDLVGIAGMTKVQVLSREKDGSYTIYGEGKPRKEWMKIASNSGGYVYPPFELTPEKWKITFVGSETEAKRFFKTLDGFGLRYGIAAAADAKFASSSFLSVLTDKQRKVLSTAYSRGFYDTPRRMGVRELAQLVNLHKSVVVEHLRKAQKKLLDEILVS